MAAPSTFAFADVWEMAADAVPERECLVIFGRDDGGTGRRTYAEMEKGANRFANWLLEHGVEPGDKVALYLENRPEYMECMLGAFKVRAVPINVNFRYVAGELRYLLDDCGARFVVVEEHFVDMLTAIIGELTGIDRTITMGTEFDETMAKQSTKRPGIERSNDDHYIIYTGGTTGMPKGVVWRQEDAFFPCIGGGDPMRMLGAVESPAELPDRIGDPVNAMLLAPFMHAAGTWVSLSYFFAGGKAVLPRGPLDAEEVWDVAVAEDANFITVIGDAVGRPLVDAWDANPGRWETPMLFSISNGGAPMSPTLKSRIAETFPNLVLADGFGSSEAGAQGAARLSADDIKNAQGVASFSPSDDTTVVLGDDNKPLEPGSDEVGRVARRGRLPLHYLNDPEKTEKTFVELDGTRWLITGDLAKVAADGSIELLGRDSATINTGGEKVHGEEVEAVLKGHPSVYDVTVVGVPDERWGKVVTAVVQAAPGEQPDLDALVDHCRGELAGYKLPKHLVVVDQVVRSPAGKADLRWATETATKAVNS